MSDGVDVRAWMTFATSLFAVIVAIALLGYIGCPHAFFYTPDRRFLVPAVVSIAFFLAISVCCAIMTFFRIPKDWHWLFLPIVMVLLIASHEIQAVVLLVCR
ncbi:hypothetical protein [Burkholderia sp. THE68]|uniref:hypothetical protein n=1 Tax=Burkholderia sp. THE68 TaxID=758782 RepID=UPI00138947AD|nr:hypothetical protein [Burkholderia sp. THE68]